jgi:hypothetical protein
LGFKQFAYRGEREHPYGAHKGRVYFAILQIFCKFAMMVQSVMGNGTGGSENE